MGRAVGRALGIPWILVCLIVASNVLFPRAARGYVLPPEQLLEFMADNVVGFETVGVTWAHRPGEEAAGKEPVTVDVWFRSAADYAVRNREGAVGNEYDGPGAWFLELFCGKAHLSERFLTRQGVDLSRSAYTRVGNTVAYRLGREMPGSPVMLLEKARFIPLLLRFDSNRVDERSGMEIRFQDYRLLGEGWFPHEIIYRYTNGEAGSYKVLDVRLNEPFPGGFTSLERATGGETVPSGESGRLEKAIKALEEKYKND